MVLVSCDEGEIGEGIVFVGMGMGGGGFLIKMIIGF